MQTVVVATSNPAKLRELRAILGALPVALRAQSEFGVAAAAENGLSFIENALIKARHASAATGLAAVADDSGLLVDVLAGAPGIYSARYGRLHATDGDNHVADGDNHVADGDNMKRLLSELAVHVDAQADTQADTQFAAHFHCAAAYMRSAEDPTPLIAAADWHGCIIGAPRGSGGFGYDPIFYLPEHDCTAAQLPQTMKNQLSHRAVAFKKLCQLLQQNDAVK